MSIINIMAALGMFLLAIGLVYAAYNFKPRHCDKKPS